MVLTHFLSFCLVLHSLSVELRESAGNRSTGEGAVLLHTAPSPVDRFPAALTRSNVEFFMRIGIKPVSPNTQAELQEVDDQIRELEDMKKGFLAKALRHEDQAERLQFRERYYLEARRHMELAEENRQAAKQIQIEIDRLKQRRQQILEKNGAGDGFEDL